MTASASSQRTEGPRQRATAWLSHGLEVLIHDVHARSAPGRSDSAFDFDVIIVGSGYGGAIAADRLAGRMSPDRICVLERGREYLPGSFPRRLSELPGHLRFTTPAMAGPQGRLEGLFDVRVGEDMSVLVANGLGGGSLINAGVLELPQPRVFAEPAWPKALRDEGFETLEKRGEALRTSLGAKTTGPAADPELPRRAAMRKLTHRLASKPLAISIALDDEHVTHGGVKLDRCINCGDCFTGCNFDAKDSLDVNLLARAHKRGVQIYTGATVTRLSKSTNAQAGWTLHVVHTDSKLCERMAKPFELTARVIVLAAGTLGTTELLMRSRDDGLAFSTQLGRRFSGNGDMLASLYDTTVETGGVADEGVAPDARRSGPTITSMIDLRDDVEADCVIQDLGVPAALRRLFEEATATSSLMHRLETFDWSSHHSDTSTADPYAVDPDKVKRSLSVAIIGRDAADGVLEPVAEDPSREASDQPSHDSKPHVAGLRIVWPQARADRMLDRGQGALERLAVTSGVGRVTSAPWKQRLKRSGPKHVSAPDAVLPNPMWRLLPPQTERLLGTRRGPLLTVHPLGGCVMADDRRGGMVDHLGRVFDGAATKQHTDTHPGLLVLDGSIVPTSLGINPALTIALLADRAIEKLPDDFWSTAGITLAPSEPGLADPNSAAAVRRPYFKAIAKDQAPPPERATQVQVVEKLAGRVILDGQGHHVELRLVYQLADLRQLAVGPDRGSTPDNPIRMGRTLELDPARSRVLVFDGDGRPDPGRTLERDPKDALFDAPLGEGSTLRILHRQPSSWIQRIWRSWRPWLLQRGVRDAVQAAGEWMSGSGGTLPLGRRIRQSLALAMLQRGVRDAVQAAGERMSGSGGTPLGRRIRQSLALATRAGDVRLFEYHLVLGQPEERQTAEQTRRFEALRKGSRITGTKRITYGWRCSPWTQLMRLELTRFGDLALRCRAEDRRLHVDPLHFVREQVPLARVVEQQDQPTALVDLAGFLLYVARVLVGVHLWTFRKPDAPGTREPQRLPVALDGLPPPQIHELGNLPPPTRDPAAAPGHARLTRYPPKNLEDARPVLMIHGYSASGTTFAHPKVVPSLAERLWHEGFDPWIVDLRTSCGLPTATLPWTFEDIARADIPAAIEFICRATGQDKIDVVSHCMGSAMLAMSILDPERKDDAYKVEEHIDSWVMSQIGPAMQLTPANTLRAYLLRYVVCLLPRLKYEFRAGGQAPGFDGDMFDRFLSSLPNLNDASGSEFDRENPRWPFAHTPWVGTRHRIDALFGRVFDSRNMSQEALEHIDDFFGPFNLVTVSQPMYFARARFVTDAEGGGVWGQGLRYRQRLQALRMTSLHGKRNGLADPRTQHRLADALGTLRHPDGSPSYRETEVFESLGHQDSLIGFRTRDVFDKISAFLRTRSNNSGSKSKATRRSSSNWVAVPASSYVPSSAIGSVACGRALSADLRQVVGAYVLPVRESSHGRWEPTCRHVRSSNVDRTTGKAWIEFDFASHATATKAFVFFVFDDEPDGTLDVDEATPTTPAANGLTTIWTPSPIAMMQTTPAPQGDPHGDNDAVAAAIGRAFGDGSVEHPGPRRPGSTP